MYSKATFCCRLKPAGVPGSWNSETVQPREWNTMLVPNTLTLFTHVLHPSGEVLWLSHWKSAPLTLSQRKFRMWVGPKCAEVAQIQRYKSLCAMVALRWGFFYMLFLLPSWQSNLAYNYLWEIASCLGRSILSLFHTSGHTTILKSR